MSADNVQIVQAQQKNGGYKNIQPRWKPGESGNPGGRRKGYVQLGSAYQRLGALSVDALKAYEPENVIEAGIKNTLLRAAEAKSWKAAQAAIKEIADRVEGKAVARRADVTESEIVAAARRDYELGRRYVLALNASLGEICCEGCAEKIQGVFAESDLIQSILSTTDEKYREVVERELESIAGE